MATCDNGNIFAPYYTGLANLASSVCVIKVIINNQNERKNEKTFSHNKHLQVQMYIQGEPPGMALIGYEKNIIRINLKCWHCAKVIVGHLNKTFSC